MPHLIKAFTFFAVAITIALTTSAASAVAGTPIGAETAQSYYQNCASQPEQNMSKETQDLFCKCTSFQMQKNMTIEDIQTMAQQSQAGRNALNRMILDVYAPCMEFPVRDLIFNNCRSNEFQVNAGICACLSSKMAAFTAESAQAELKQILQTTPNITDPLGPIIESPKFKQMEKRLALECIQQKR